MCTDHSLIRSRISTHSILIPRLIRTPCPRVPASPCPHLSSAPGEPVSLMTTFQRLFGSGPIILLQSIVLMILAVVAQRRFDPPRPPWPHWFGIILGMASVGSGVWICRAALAALPIRERGKALITSGPFRWVRKPLYAGMLLGMGLGTFFIGHTYFGLLTWLLSYPAAHLLIRYEESLMQEKFGNEWRIYAQRTPRFLPRITRQK